MSHFRGNYLFKSHFTIIIFFLFSLSLLEYFPFFFSLRFSLYFQMDSSNLLPAKSLFRRWLAAVRSKDGHCCGYMQWCLHPQPTLPFPTTYLTYPSSKSVSSFFGDGSSKPTLISILLRFPLNWCGWERKFLTYIFLRGWARKRVSERKWESGERARNKERKWKSREQEREAGRDREREW